MKIAARRERGRRRRKVDRNAACAVCGETSPEGLRLIEWHHTDREGNDQTLIIPVCLTHHRILSMRSPSGTAPLSTSRPVPDKVLSILKERAVFFAALAEADTRRAAEFEHFLKWLDEQYPGWRSALRLNER